MASIKISHKSTIRRFTVPKSITWPEFEQQVHIIFSLPSSSSILVSYKDEDGDEITVSSDLELNDIILQNAGSTILFRLISTNEIENASNSLLLQQNQQEQTQSVSSAIPLESKRHVNFNKSQESISATPRNLDPNLLISPFDSENLQEKKKAREIQTVAQKFKKLVDEFRDVLDTNPILVNTNNIMDQILDGVPVNLDSWAEWMNGYPIQNNQNSSQQRSNAERKSDNSNSNINLNPCAACGLTPNTASSNQFTNCPNQNLSQNFSGHDSFNPMRIIGHLMKKAIFALLVLFFAIQLFKFVLGLAIPIFIGALTIKFFRRNSRGFGGRRPHGYNHPHHNHGFFRRGYGWGRRFGTC
ncbi:hypothetical protein G9A89_011205 [Geosiphon pyriformis]|nr:hypothetical protein G9A89_011205 [Geosiphon pyriformis]